MPDVLAWLPAVLIIGAILVVRMLPKAVFTVVRPTAFVAIVILVGAILLFLPSQGRELVDGISSPDCSLGSPFSCPVVLFTACVMFWAQSSWFSAKVALIFSNVSWPEHDPLFSWLPTIYRFIVYAVAAIALVLSLGRNIDEQIAYSLLLLVGVAALDGFGLWILASRLAAQDRNERAIRENVGGLSKITLIPPSAGATIFMLGLFFTKAAWNPVESGVGSLTIVLYALGLWTVLTLVVSLVLGGIQSKWRLPAFFSLLVLLVAVVAMNLI
jgi:hypothetical protein